MQGQYNMRSPAVKRLMKEAQELREATEQYYAQPLEDNLFEWHFTLRGPADSEFETGLYHGRIILPPDYPMKPPSIILLTPNGRFEIFKKICLSISGHHPESWQPSWSIRTALLAIIGFMPTHGAGALGSLDYTPDERKVLAKRSLDWRCPTCGDVRNVLLPVTEASKATEEEAKRLATQIDFQGEKEKTTNSETAPSSTPTDSPSPPEAAPNVPPHPGFPSQMPFGQMPFNQFQMPFPMMPPNPPGGNNNSTPYVPRFPMPFMPPMVSGFNPAGGTNPFMAGNRPMFPPNVRTTAPSSTGATSASSGPTSVPSVTLPSPATLTIPNTSVSPSSVIPTATAPEIQTNSSAQSTATSATTTTSMAATSQSEGLRQRTTAAPAESEASRQHRTAAPGRVGQNAEISDRPRSGGTASMLLMIILAAAIGLLCLRRLMLAGLWE